MRTIDCQTVVQMSSTASTCKRLANSRQLPVNDGRLEIHTVNVNFGRTSKVLVKNYLVALLFGIECGDDGGCDKVAPKLYSMHLHKRKAGGFCSKKTSLEMHLIIENFNLVECQRSSFSAAISLAEYENSLLLIGVRQISRSYGSFAVDEAR